MKSISIYSLLLLAFIISSCGQPKVSNSTVEKSEKMELTHKEKAVALLNSFNTGDQTPISYINPTNYVQHNLAVGDGLAGFGEVMHHAPEGGLDINDKEKTENNKALIKDFITTILINGEMDKVANYFDGDNYIQHNPSIGDGLSGLGAALQAMAEQGIKMEFHKIHKILGEGNFVLAMSEGTFAGQPTSYYDLFRVENGKIAEHWDVIETITAEADRKNQNGKF